MIGLPLTKVTVDAQYGGLVRDIFLSLEKARIAKDRLDTVANGDLEALGYTPTEVAQLKSAIDRLAALREVAHGDATVAVAEDFFAFGRLLLGVGF